MDSSINIPWAKPSLGGNEHEYVSQALLSTWISGGPFVERFEEDFSNCIGSKYSLTVSNGTTALHLAYLSSKLDPGDEVIVPGFAFMAAANIALHMHATPIFVEVDANTWCLTADNIEKKLTSRTKLIVPIHTYGNVCDMDEIMELGKDRNINVIEDAAEAFASLYKGLFAGTLATVGTYSFHATKTITTGEGGMVVTNDKDIYDNMSLYRNHGMLRKRFYWHDAIGHNFRMTNMQAALGCAQIEKLDQIKKARKRIYDEYKLHLSNFQGITLQLFLPHVTPVLWAFALKLDPKAFPQGRDELINQLNEENIETRPGFYSPSLMKIYKSDKLPICEDLSRNIICLPTFQSLNTEQIEIICNKLKNLKK